MIIALTSSSKSRGAKIAAALRKALSGDDTIVAGFRYPVQKIAKMFGWDNRYDERGKKLINTLYNAGVEYDKNIWLDKMEKFVSRDVVRKKTIIITDLDDKKQADMLKRVENVRIMVVGDHSDISRGGLIDVYIESDCSVDDIVAEILKRAKCI